MFGIERWSRGCWGGNRDTYKIKRYNGVMSLYNYLLRLDQMPGWKDGRGNGGGAKSWYSQAFEKLVEIDRFDTHGYIDLKSNLYTRSLS